MRIYETVIVLKSDLADSKVASFTKKVEKVIGGKPGEILKKDDWGLRRMAYPIKGEKKGRYIVWTYRQLPEAIRGLDRATRFDEDMLRTMTIVSNRKGDAKTDKAAKKKAAKPAPTPPPSDEGEGGKRGFGRRKPAIMLTDRKATIDYKDVNSLTSFISERGKIVPQRVSGMNAYQQRALAQAIKRARQIALLSFETGIGASTEEGR